MKLRILTSLAAASGIAAGAAILPDPQPRPDVDHADTTSFKVDPVHSSLVFRIEHLGVSHFYGRINSPSGTFTLNPEAPDASQIAIDADVNNIDTANEDRDTHLKSPDFFNAREFPRITFRSTRIATVDDKTFDVTGDLTMHGVTKEITARIENFRDAETRMGHRAGFNTEFTIKRSDFGIDLYVDSGALGDEVKIIVGVEGIGG